MKQKLEKILKQLEEIEFELDKGGDSEGLDLILNLYLDWGRMKFGDNFGKGGK